MTRRQEPVTDLEIFQVVRTHLLSQGRRAYFPDQGCAYRAPDGTKCAVGCLLTDEEYCPSLEMQPLEDVLLRVPRLFPHWELLRYLQIVHDWMPPKWWEEELSRFRFSEGVFTHRAPGEARRFETSVENQYDQ